MTAPAPARADLFAHFNCEHTERRLRRRTLASGTVTYWHQCSTCGHGVQVRKSGLCDLERLTASEWDSDLHDRWYRDQLDTYKATEDAKWWAWYSSYLQSEQWLHKRELVLNRARGRCEGCGERRATQVHHLTYQRAGDEMLFDLAAICDHCHDRIHRDKDHHR